MAPINVVILDDHQGIIDGYRFRLSQSPNINVVATITLGDDLEPTLAQFRTDLLIMDVQVPINADNPTPFPILNVIPKLLSEYPDLNILVITMHSQPMLVKSILNTGVSGYILKDDRVSIQELSTIIPLLVEGGIHLSQEIYKLVMKPQNEKQPALNPRQLEALTLSATHPDDSTAKLASQMNIESSTLRNLLSGAYLKLGVRTRAAAITKAYQLGLIPQHSFGLEISDSERE